LEWKKIGETANKRQKTKIIEMEQRSARTLNLPEWLMAAFTLHGA